ncbi:hypothetical protein [Agrobacterium sp. fls2-241-TYG-188a]|uniref:hypothetical protein n=1 Tax=Agrobacterium sp. fls2-241-TYG-188a TaxID=3040275 RepID=UPI0025508E6B|nr:hypothetical protein [Agrobacterium sp. fls2-241-TYG-188a]
MTEKRMRGRPKGTGKDDLPHLIKIAELMVENRITKQTTAMRTYLVATRPTIPFQETDDTIIRRWQDKWKNDGGKLLAAAQERIRTRTERATRTVSSSRQQFQNDHAKEILNPSMMRQINAMLAVSFEQRTMFKTVAKQVREMQQDSTLKRAYEAAQTASSHLQEMQRLAKKNFF